MNAAVLLALIAVAAPVRAAWAGDAPQFHIEFADGGFEPRRLEVPAHATFEIQLVNRGKGPAEFESKQLHKEKVLAPGVTTTMVIRNLDPGEYDFFDDFHPETPPAALIAK